MVNNSSMKDSSYLSGSSSSGRKVININFICSGNTCRSYIAEAVASYLVKNVYSKKYPSLKNRVVIGSAGTDVSAKSIPLNSIKVLDMIEVPNIKFKPRQADKKLVKNSDLIITMATTHSKNLAEDFPEMDRSKLFNLTELSNMALYLQSEEIFFRAADVAGPVTVDKVKERIRIIRQARPVSIVNPYVTEVNDPFGRSIDVYVRVAKLIEENIITVFNYIFR